MLQSTFAKMFHLQNRQFVITSGGQKETVIPFKLRFFGSLWFDLVSTAQLYCSQFGFYSAVRDMTWSASIWDVRFVLAWWVCDWTCDDDWRFGNQDVIRDLPTTVNNRQNCKTNGRQTSSDCQLHDYIDLCTNKVRWWRWQTDYSITTSSITHML